LTGRRKTSQQFQEATPPVTQAFSPRTFQKEL
jgi:hypothetical protein